MATLDLSKFTGELLFEYYTSKQDDYAQTLGTAFMEVGDKLYGMLEQAQKTGKRITLKEDLQDVNDPPITVTIE